MENDETHYCVFTYIHPNLIDKDLNERRCLIFIFSSGDIFIFLLRGIHFYFIFMLSILRYFPFSFYMDLSYLKLFKYQCFKLSCLPSHATFSGVVFTVCSHIFTLFWLTKPSVCVEKSHHFLCDLLMFVFHLETSPLFSKSYPILLLFIH